MIKHPNRTGTYLGSITNDAAGLAELAQVRAENKVHNATERLLKLKDPTYRSKLKKVVAFGRLGKNNPNAEKYKAPRPHGFCPWSKVGNYQYIAKADAATLDIYIHTEYHYGF
jgi:hypothetical protein